MNQMTEYDFSICTFHESKRISVSLCGWTNQKPHWKTYPCHQCPRQIAPCSTAALSPLNSSPNCIPREKAHRREENKCESPCVAIQQMSKFLPWTKGMEMLEKGRKEQAHDLLEMWSENYGQSPRSTPQPATVLLLPMSSTSGSETLSFCLLTSKCTPPLSSVQESLWPASVMIYETKLIYSLNSQTKCHPQKNS